MAPIRRTTHQEDDAEGAASEVRQGDSAKGGDKLNSTPGSRLAHFPGLLMFSTLPCDE